MDGGREEGTISSAIFVGAAGRGIYWLPSEGDEGGEALPLAVVVGDAALGPPSSVLSPHSILGAELRNADVPDEIRRPRPEKTASPFSLTARAVLPTTRWVVAAVRATAAWACSTTPLLVSAPPLLLSKEAGVDDRELSSVPDVNDDKDDEEEEEVVHPSLSALGEYLFVDTAMKPAYAFSLLTTRVLMASVSIDTLSRAAS